MSSSRSKRRSQGSEYPSQWSEWVWSEELERHYRTRLRGPDEYEYEYAQLPSTPRARKEGLQSIAETMQDRNDTTTETDLAKDIMLSQSQTSLDPAPNPYSSSGPSVPPSLSTETPYSAGNHPSAAPYVSSPEIKQSYASPSTVWQNHIRTRDPATDREEFDPHYKVHGAWEFKWGRVFKLLWDEPKGADMGSGGGSGTSSLTVRKSAGKDVYAKVRRFVIIQPLEGHCICLPILTYSGQGVNGSGVHAAHHAIIYSGKKPVAFRGEKEKGLEMRSIKVMPENSRHKLDDASRLNYAKTYSVEYNVKVWFIGKIHADFEWKVRTDYNRVHPPLEIKAERPSDAVVDDASEHQGGAAYEIASIHRSGYTSHTAPNTTPPGYSPAYPQSPEHGKYEHAEEGSSVSAGKYANPYLPVSSSHQSQASFAYTSTGVYGNSDSSRYATAGYGREYDQEEVKAAEGGYDAPDRLKSWDQHYDLKSTEDSERSSSPESMGSDEPSRGSSTTSLSLGGRPVVHELLVNVVRQDAELRALCDQAIQKATWDRLEKNLRRCLVQLSKDIRIEMQSRQATQAARAIRTFAISAAQSIIRNIELQESTKESSERTAGMYDLSTQVDPNSEGSDDDEMDPIDELEDPMAEFKYFEDLVVSSKSFEWFKERFHLCVNPDQARSAVFQQWPRLSPKSSQQSLSYDIAWDLEFFIDTHVKDPIQIGNLIAINGEAVHAEALSCREYLSRACPDISTLLLKSIELLSLHKSNLCILNEEAKLEIIRTEGVAGEQPRVSLKATAVYKIHVQIATAVSWMCASFRSSPHAEIMMSSVLVNVVKSTPTNDTSITIRPGALHQPFARSCWHSLFPNRVVARGFPVSSRHQGVGLEISFENMATASRCLTFVGYENGLIVHGLISVLIPMKILEKDDALQWHLEDKRNQKQYKLARISQVLSSSPAFQDRLKVRQPEYLMGKRCFLGLAEHANVVIGTKSYQRRFDWSRSPFAPTETSFTSHSITFGTGFMGFFGANSTHTRTSTVLQSTICTDQEEDILHVLALGRDNLALLFDTAKNLGWYVPQISLALQMTHAIISAGDYGIYDEDGEISNDGSLSFADPSPDAAAAAADAVKRSLRLRVKKHQSELLESESEFEDFRDIFKKVLHTLSNIETNLESAKGDFRKARHVAPEFIHGVEFRDAMQMRPSIRIKTFKVGQAWAHLTSEHPLVIFSRNIEPPIVPGTARLCQSWQLVPSNRSYLVLMGLAIASILDRRSEGLADGLDWNTRTDLLECHKPGERAPVNHAQRLASRRKTRSNSPIRETMHKYQTSCFVFGPDTDSECRESIAASRNPISEKLTSSTADMPAITTQPDLATHRNDPLNTREGRDMRPQYASVAEFQTSAAIRLKFGNCESEPPLYVANGSIHNTNLGSRSLDGSAQTQRKSRVKSTLHKLFPNSPEKQASSKLLSQTETKTLGNGSTDPGECDDLYDA